MTVLVLSLPAVAAAAEVLQVRSGTLLQVGDHNRTYSVELACLELPANGDEAAAAWLRQQLPRRTRVNLRPVGNQDGTLLARVQRLDGSGAGVRNDLSDGLIQAGLAAALPECAA
ncbi:MAG: nuclease [Synechococcaceae bacterium WB4_1_0192]|nr:nuclease [Synechococcaceae bacterium WB4_1_0192]